MRLLELILKLLGLDGEQNGINKTAGVLNYAALLPVAVWLYRHHSEIITFQVDIGTLGLAVGAVFTWLEFNRRT